MVIVISDVGAAVLVFLQNTSVGECLAAPMAPVGTFTCENTTPFAVQRQYHQSKFCCIQHNTGHSSETVPPVSLAASNTTPFAVQRQYHQPKSCCIQHNTGHSSETVPPAKVLLYPTNMSEVRRTFMPKSD